MEQYIICNTEAEGHINSFPDRKCMWDIMKTSDLQSLCQKFGEKHAELCKKFKKQEQALVKQVAWTDYLTDLATSSHLSYLLNDYEDGLFHLCSLVQTAGKYAYVFLVKQTTNPNSTCAPAMAPINRISEQSDSGLLMLGSGCIGQMFRLYKSNRSKYGTLMKPLAKMIVRDKKSTFVPVEQACRDRGGLYVLRTDFLPRLECSTGACARSLPTLPYMAGIL